MSGPGAFTGGGSFENILPQQGIEGTRPSLGPLGLSLVVVVFKTFCPSGIEGKLQSQGTSPGQ